MCVQLIVNDDYLRHFVKNMFVPMEPGEPEQEEEDLEMELQGTRTMIHNYDIALRDSVSQVSTAILCMCVPQQLSRSVPTDTR